MMRLLLTLLAALGFVWAALNTSRAEERVPAAAEIVDATTEPKGEDKPAAVAVRRPTRRRPRMPRKTPRPGRRARASSAPAARMRAS